MATSAECANPVLVALLTEAGLTPRGLAREMNRLFGPGTVAETAPYYWRDAGGVPRRPLPALAAYVLSRQLGRVVTVGQLWQGHAPDGEVLLPSNVGMDRPWMLASTMLVAEDWLLGGLVDRRMFLSVSGAALANAVSVYLAARATNRSPAQPAGSPDDPLVAQIEASVPHLQRLDDERGGAAGLGYVGAQVRAVLLVLREHEHTPATTRRLLIALSDLAQLAGWMAFDAGQHGLAQRYFFTGLRAAHDSGYRAMEAHILADLAFQATSRGESRDGTSLGEAAARRSAGTPAAVRASVSSRLAYAYAGAGRIEDCDRAWKESQQHLADRAGGVEPSWMYYLTPNHLDCQAGYAMILAGRRVVSDGEPNRGRELLRKGASLLRTGAYARSMNDPSQRRALVEGAWLAIGYTAQGKLAEACGVARLALPRLAQVRSPRSVALLADLSRDLRRRQRNTSVADLLPDLVGALARHPSGASVSP